MKPLISVIVPVYNVEKYVLKCLESIREQTYQNIEIVIVDDGATDKSSEICEDFVKKEKRARVYHKKNGGLSSARNFGIKKAKGEIVAFVDSDDLVKRDFIAKMYGKMENSGADIAVCGYNDDIPNDETISGKEATIKLLTKQENIEIIAWNKLYKKNLFIDNDIWFPEGDNHEDTLTTYKLLYAAKKVSYISESLYVYVERKESITNQERLEERLNMRERAALEAVEYFESERDLKQAAEIGLLWAKYNYLNYAISGEIDQKYGKESLKWIQKNRKLFLKNQFLTPKLKIYNLMSAAFGGVPYKISRKISGLR